MGEKILVVENEEKWRDILLTMLRRAPYELCVAKSCEEAEELLKQHEFALVTINMNLADIPTVVNDQLGFDVLELLQEYPNLPRIVLTSEIKGPIFSTYIPFGVNEILFKPTLTRPQLLQAIQNAIGQRGKPKKPYDRSSLCDLMNKHTTGEHVRLLQQKLKVRLPSERAFSSYENLQGGTKIERLDYILEVLESYGLVFTACQFLMEIKPDDISLKQGIEEIAL
jgi:DNA-binding NtrC family response regulator